MTQKRKLILGAVILVALVFAIITSTKMFGEAKVDPFRGSNTQSPTIVVTQMVEPHSELAWDCDGIPCGGGGG